MVAASSPRTRSARERLLDTADRLFHEEGVHAVGIDRVLEQSGVAKGSLYYNFDGKDDLVRTYCGTGTPHGLPTSTPGSLPRPPRRARSSPFRGWLHELFATILAEGGYRDAGKLTVQLILLYDGASPAVSRRSGRVCRRRR